ncbi:hypothetical protein Bca52824_016070 [Brassica carinata]|uniref:Uncharacterized protein n=1 Tax=Brassica carinata TaxID=52824 RepID=A0A8X8B692_BRACI|nr:hypothetical protein Bca52824_016070 [Brassica carinata]
MVHGTKRDSPALSERETGDENESDNAQSCFGVLLVYTPKRSYTNSIQRTRTPNGPEDAHQPETPGTAAAVLIWSYSHYLLITGTRRFRDQEHVQVTWEESNPNLYRSVKTVCSSHPAFSPNPYSEPKVASTGIEDNREPVSLNVCTEKVPSAAVDVGVRHAPIIEESNPECPTMEGDEKYDSCREDISTDSQMQEKRGNPVSDMEEDSNYVASGGKHQRKISSKICGVYTPDARLKGFFESE